MKHLSKTLSADQATIVRQYVDMYDLDPTQITFEGSDLNPIFDHNAISVLSLRLTDIADISPTSTQHDAEFVTVFGTTTLPDGRTRGSLGVCSFGETLPNGEEVKTLAVAIGLATSRCFRQGIRNVGINLHTAHQKFARTGEIATSHTNADPRQAVYAEIHILATELDLIIDGNKTNYREYLQTNYAGRDSARQLDDVELQRLVNTFRSLSRARRHKLAA